MAMTLSQLVWRSMRKNMKHYYLYFFSLIFSVTLCFSFITLQYNEAVSKASQGGTASAGFGAITYVLYFIIVFFVLYANHLFMKRRSKEIGLYQLIGMTKGLIVRLIAIENIVLFVFAVGVGIILGFLSSRLFAMILMHLLEKEVVINLTFSVEALTRSIILFSILLVIVLLQMVWMIRRVTLLSLFNAAKQADERVKPFNLFQMVMGTLGLVFIAYGYYESTRLFDVESVTNDLMLNMLIILTSTIFGTFLVFRFSVSFLMNIVRVRKKGHLSLNDVLAVTPIMHRMKGNAKSLTLITTLTGLAVGISSLSYISYYSAAVSAQQYAPYDYALINDRGTEFLTKLQEEGIKYEEDSYQISEVTFNLQSLTTKELAVKSPMFDREITMSVIPLSDYQQLVPKARLKDGEAILASYKKMLAEILPLEKGKEVTLKANNQSFKTFVVDISEEHVLSAAISNGAPIFVVDDALFEKIKLAAGDQSVFHSQIGINLLDKENNLERAEVLYENLKEERTVYSQKHEEGQQGSFLANSYEVERKGYVASVGMAVFVTAFLGLAFLLTTGSILYFKQMSEAEEEKASYTILRKIGYSTSDIMKGIYMKQLFNFGVPVFIGLLHSYFAVKSGWFLFGTELITPIVITMCLYVAMYAVFAVLSVGYYKKVVNESL